MRLKGSDILRGKFVRGMAAGALIGAAAGLWFLPNMKGSNRNRFENAGRKITGFTSNIWDGIRGSIRE